ncbi:hypothetical protein [Alteromonas gilva]|uniref:DUF1707 domain-containing protein n=1 Tax=Alteromonas gilva TaxID=2987522 RepID=A0ABT5L0I5_9ALTE|nr:hypothetical protein [Alteromonas gilva]MDC8830006.1 hypothetical protein [Alteromonas gilva]
MAIDYRNYSKSDLEEALGTIDKARFPQRVEQIEQLLAEKKNNEASEPLPEDEILLPEPETVEQAQRKILGTLAMVFAGLVVGAMLLPVYFHSFLLNGAMVAPFKWAAWIVAIVAFALTCRYMLRTDFLRKANANLLARGKRPMTVNSRRRLYGALGGALIVAIFVALATFRGAPVALHLYVMNSKPASQQVTISALPQRYRRKHCNGKIYLQEYDGQFFNYVCQITSRTQWQSLRPGQKVLLRGSRSSLGFLAEDISI